MAEQPLLQKWAQCFIFLVPSLICILLLIQSEDAFKSFKLITYVRYVALWLLLIAFDRLTTWWYRPGPKSLSRPSRKTIRASPKVREALTGYRRRAYAIQYANHVVACRNFKMKTQSSQNQLNATEKIETLEIDNLECSFKSGPKVSIKIKIVSILIFVICLINFEMLIPWSTLKISNMQQINNRPEFKSMYNNDFMLIMRPNLTAEELLGELKWSS